MSTRKFFKDYKLHSPYGLVQFFVVFEKFTCAYLFQIALEIIWLPILISIIIVLFWPKYTVPRQIKPGILNLTISKGERNLHTGLVLLAAKEKAVIVSFR